MKILIKYRLSGGSEILENPESVSRIMSVKEEYTLLWDLCRKIVSVLGKETGKRKGINFHINVLYLTQNDNNKYKVCHHLSLFSLLDEVTDCNITSSVTQRMINMKDISELGTESYHDCTIIDGISVRLLKFDKNDTNTNTTNAPHSCRKIGDLWYHKFGGYTFIAAINFNESKYSDGESINEDYKTFIENFGYYTVKEIVIRGCEIPKTVLPEQRAQELNIVVEYTDKCTLKRV